MKKILALIGLLALTLTTVRAADGQIAEDNFYRFGNFLTNVAGGASFITFSNNVTSPTGGIIVKRYKGESGITMSATYVSTNGLSAAYMPTNLIFNFATSIDGTNFSSYPNLVVPFQFGDVSADTYTANTVNHAVTNITAAQLGDSRYIKLLSVQGQMTNVIQISNVLWGIYKP